MALPCVKMFGFDIASREVEKGGALRVGRSKLESIPAFD